MICFIEKCRGNSSFLQLFLKKCRILIDLTEAAAGSITWGFLCWLTYNFIYLYLLILNDSWLGYLMY